MAVARGVYESTAADYSPLVRLGDRFTGNRFAPLKSLPPLLAAHRTCSVNVKFHRAVSQATEIFSSSKRLRVLLVDLFGFKTTIHSFTII